MKPTKVIADRKSISNFDNLSGLSPSPPVKINVENVSMHQRFAIVYLTSCIEGKLDIIPPVCMCQGTEHVGVISDNGNLILSYLRIMLSV